MGREDKKLIVSIFEDVLNDDELAPRFKILQPYVYEEMVKEAMVQVGFPSDVDVKTVRYDFELSNNQDTETWAEQYMNDNDLDEDSTTSVQHDDVEIYVLDHLENMNVQISINEELNEWIERNPTIEYMGQKITSHFNPIEMASFMKRNNYTALQKKEEACIESGIPKEEARNVDYEIKNMVIKTPIETLAEIYSEEVKSDNTTAQIYLDENLYENLTTEIEYDINLLSNAEDY